MTALSAAATSSSPAGESWVASWATQPASAGARMSEVNREDTGELRSERRQAMRFMNDEPPCRGLQHRACQRGRSLSSRRKKGGWARPPRVDASAGASVPVTTASTRAGGRSTWTGSDRAFVSHKSTSCPPNGGAGPRWPSQERFRDLCPRAWRAGARSWRERSRRSPGAGVILSVAGSQARNARASRGALGSCTTPASGFTRTRRTTMATRLYAVSGTYGKEACASG